MSAKRSITSSQAGSTRPPEAWRPLHDALRSAAGPIDRFLHIEAASGITLLFAAVIAFAAANSPWAASYASFWHTEIGLRLGSFEFTRPLEWFVNDVLMVIFFFVVGLEIRREIHRGELSELRRAALPLIAALGGVVAPALVYLSVAGSPATRHGWAVPTATDIAFAVGVLALLGSRVPPALRVLLLALAVIDDLIAILVIAFFYSDGIQPLGILVALGGVAGLLGLQASGIRSKLAYFAPAVVIWGGIYAAGVHPTIAGVLIGLLTPVKAWFGPEGFLQIAPQQFSEFEQVVAARPDDVHALNASLERLSRLRREALSPAESLIESLHPWVAFFIMPIFALANAGVTLGDAPLTAETERVALGVVLGLSLGKPIGIVCLSALCTRLGIVTLPRGLTTAHLLVLGVVAGIGFTMALFTAQLAFNDALQLSAAKLGVLLGSVLSGSIGLLLGRFLLSRSLHPGAATCASDAESAAEV